LLTALVIGQNETFDKYGMYLGFTSMIIAFAFIFVAIRKYRERNGGVTFWKGLQIGLLITLIASTFYVITWMIEFHYFIPDFMDNMIAAQVKNWKAEGLSQVEIDKNMIKMESYREMYKSPVIVVLFTYMEILPLGIVVSLLAAGILRQRPTLENPRV
ncbi:MAG: DUF4199 domain-containing protein, partial [Pedobacter sp.]